MKVTAVVVSYNTRELLKSCLEALLARPGAVELEVFVVDNASTDGSAEMVGAEFPGVRLIANRDNTGFAAANLQAYHQASGEALLLLNPDAEIMDGAVEAVARFMKERSGQKAGIVGGRIVNPGGGLEPSARQFPGALRKFLTLSGLSSRWPAIFGGGDNLAFSHDQPLEVDWVPGTFTLLSMEMLHEIGFFDRRFFMYYEETDLCLRARRHGWSVWFTPGAAVVHQGGASSRTRKDRTFDSGGSQLREYRMRSEWLYFRKNHGVMSVLANAGVEMAWHLARALAHLRPGGEHKERRAHSLGIVRDVSSSLRDTRFGTLSPPAPW